ncbi:MAG: glycoside hydrolase family 95 protein [Acidobacteriota bacterium]|nr:glycoside hydrolase family 95 protein [Acidobacteriota bacterium]
MSSRTTRRSFLASSAAAAAVLATQRLQAGQTTEPATVPCRLLFRQPATRWPDSVPVGNGRLGACVFGGTSQERIQLNEESIWDGERRDRNNPAAGQAVPQIRALLFAGRVEEAEDLARQSMLAIPQRMPCYQTLGDLHLHFDNLADATDYALELNLETAIATTSFVSNGTRYTREVLSSAPDQVIAVHLRSQHPGALQLRATLDRPAHFSTQASDGRLVLQGEAIPVNDNPGLPVKERAVGIRFYAELIAVTDGEVHTDATSLQIQGATQATLLLDCATSYRFPAADDRPDNVNRGDPAAMQHAVRQHLAAAAQLPYETLRSRHIADYQHWYKRVHFDLGEDANANLATDVRMQRIKAGGEDLGLVPIYTQFGRYLLISSSRPGTLAANLQGIWNESVDPPWGSKYTVNINAQMNYWMAESANLSELHAPLFDLVDSTRLNAQQTAARYYGAGGTVVHHNTDIWGDSAPIDGLGGGIWPMGRAWLALHLWQHAQFTGDRRFLAQRAYPTLRDNAAFLLDYLVRDPQSGHLVTGPSCSPENKYLLPDGRSHNLCMAPTMDIEITRAVLERTLACATMLGEADDTLLQRARQALPQLPPLRISHDGRLQEWAEDYADQEPGHRHISHLFALYPEAQITPRGTPELAAACRKTLDKRLAAGGGSTGWSRAWIVNCMARLEDGDAAYSNLLALLRQCTRHNLFDVCGLKENSPFQIDGNLGGPAGILEMLLQSHDGEAAAATGIVRVLPALPQAWQQGRFRGLRARGGFEVSAAWQRGRLRQVRVQASQAHPLRLAVPANTGALRQQRNATGLQRNHDGIFHLSMHAGQTIELNFV